MKKLLTAFKFLFLLTTCFLLVKCKKDTTEESTFAPISKIAPLYRKTDVITKIATDVAPANINPVTVKSKPVVINGGSNQVISGLQIQGGKTACIELLNCSDMTIQNCILYGSTQEGIHMYNCKNVTVINCFIFNVSSGVYAGVSSGINVCYNQFLNMQGPDPGGNFVQFDNVSGAGNMINYNMCENIFGQSNPYDEISIYESNGTPDSPIQINGNYIRGGGPSTYSAGIQLGDSSGSYQIAENNIMVNPGQDAIDVATGTNIQVLNNKIYGKELSFSNVGICVWNEYNSSCAIITVSGNSVNWTDAYGDENDRWNGGGCGKITGWADNTWKAPIDSTIMPAKIITKLFPK